MQKQENSSVRITDKIRKTEEKTKQSSSIRSGQFSKDFLKVIRTNVYAYQTKTPQDVQDLT